jgi:YD repeat-containing protein
VTGTPNITENGLSCVALAKRDNLRGLDGNTYTYDTENRLTGATVAGTTTSYVYTPFGMRRFKTVAGTMTGFTPDPVRNQEITVFDASFNATSRYVYGPGVDDLIVWVDPNNSASKGYFHQDGHGSTLAQTNGAGTVDSQYSYSGYGLPTNTGASPSE